MSDASNELLYSDLDPNRLMAAVESTGRRCDATFLTLNSYENRVYQIGIEDSAPIVAKFYRPGRWSDAAILEEHAFALTLAEQEIPVVPPLVADDGTTLHSYDGYRFALYPRRGGRWPDLEDFDKLEWLGRFLGRIHAFGSVTPFSHRPALDTQTFGHQPWQYLQQSGLIPADIQPAYLSVMEMALQQIENCFQRCGDYQPIRLHGDCHPGNILWTDDGPHFVDLDDCRMGPAIQDLWMLLSGERAEMAVQLGTIVEGYEEFHDFDRRQLHLLEALRTLRQIHYTAWLARRWGDPAFPIAFPWFNTQRYWEEQILQLREQVAAMDEPALHI
jgi:Ser/Thr protein kinase RdoA (MazF antagonist)